MRVVLVSGIFPTENMSEILLNSKGVVQLAADTLQKAIIDGFLGNGFDFDLINLPFIGSYPRRYKYLFSPNNSFEICNNESGTNKLLGKNYRFLTLSLLRYKSKELVTYKALKRWANQYENEDKVILIYSLSVSALKAAISIKKKYGNTKIVCIVPDLPQFVSAGGTSKIREWYQERNTKSLQSIYSKIDGFVVLCESMIVELKATHKPYTVVEGIYNSKDEEYTQKVKETETKNKNIVYAGTLARRYGIMNLVNAFEKIPDSNIRLIIFGQGDALNDIYDVSERDNRIKIMGNKSHAEVLAHIRNASLLVNPRTPEGEFTRYSFPSKTMEYLASGVPTILYELEGIPKEYFQYCYTLKDLTINALAEKIKYVLSKVDEGKECLGGRAREFILSEKNPKTQSKKIIELINKLYVSI